MAEVRADAIRERVRYLADDALQGRDTGTMGGLLAARYIAGEMEKIGLKPAGGSGTYFQRIPFVRKQIDPDKSGLVVSTSGTATSLQFGRDFVTAGLRVIEGTVDAPMVFAGYGITAPEFKYDDYSNVDVKGKVVVALSGEPVSRDPAFFDGDRDTRHSFDFGKTVSARTKGAVAFILVRTGRTRGAGWEQLVGFASRPSVQLPPAPSPTGMIPSLTVREESAVTLFESVPGGWEEVRKQAADGALKPVALTGQAKITLAVQRSTTPSDNVAGLLEGSDPELKKQVVLYTAHYDHIGLDEGGQGDIINNGAWDNASGTAEVLEIAHAFAAMRPAPRRSILFLLVTGEELGLLGSRYYAQHPLVPLEQTAANINLDMTDIIGVPKNLIAIGAEHSSLESVVAEVAREMGMKVSPDPEPGLNYFRRSDQYSFVEAGVPALVLRHASEYEGMTDAEAKARSDEKWRTIYHRVADNFDPTWSWEGMRRHAQACFLMGIQVANDPKMPAWKEGNQYNKPRKAPETARPGRG